MYLGISTQKAKSRRVTNKQKNKVVNKAGGGARAVEDKAKAWFSSFTFMYLFYFILVLITILTSNILHTYNFLYTYA